MGAQVIQCNKHILPLGRPLIRGTGGHISAYVKYGYTTFSFTPTGEKNDQKGALRTGPQVGYETESGWVRDRGSETESGRGLRPNRVVVRDRIGSGLRLN